MNTYLYIAIMALTTYAIRVLPLTLIRKPIKSRFLRSFLYYVPYVTLAVMTFPAITTATGSPVAGACAMAQSADDTAGTGDSAGIHAVLYHGACSAGCFVTLFS